MKITYSQAINKAIEEEMQRNKNLVCFGLGANDNMKFFGTTKGLKEKFGEQRVFETPTSENAMTGIGIGMSLYKNPCIMMHQRLDFFLLAMDQLVNSAAKWHYMFGGIKSVPITIRLVVGKGWGQGPTHSQNLQSWFNHIPGLKVVMPSYADDAKGLLISSIFDSNPVIFLEHRWLHSTNAIVNQGNYKVKIGKAKICKKGKHITILSMSYLTLEAVKASKYLYDKFKISAEIIDLRTIKPLDWTTIFYSIKKTRRLLVLDTGFTTGSVAAEIIAKITIEKFNLLKVAPIRLAMPDVPEPTSSALTKNFYTRADDIVISVLKSLRINHKNVKLDFKQSGPADVPDSNFKGPF